MHRFALSFLLLALSALIALPLMGASAAPDAERPVRLCVDPAWAPFEYHLDKQGQHQGMAADYWQRMTERVGLRTEIVPTESWEEALEKAERRECDVLTLAMKTPDRSQHWLFTEPYVSYPFVLATRSEAPSVSRLEEVADKTLAAVKGYAYTELVRERYPQIRFLEVENITEGLERVRRGEAYGLIDSLATVAYAIQQAQLHEERDAVRDLGLAMIREGRCLAGFVNQVIDRNGRALWVSTSGMPIRDQPGQVIGFRGIDIDVDERRQQRDLLQHYAFYDGLTEIANRRLFHERLDAAIAHFGRHGLTVAVLAFDLDHFKAVNDTYGHAAGDALLCQFTTLAQSCLRRGDLLARLGGEEFAALLFETNAEGALQTAERIRACVAAEPRIFESHQIALIVSIGVTCIRGNDSPESLLARADASLYAAKQVGRNRVVIHDCEQPAAEVA